MVKISDALEKIELTDKIKIFLSKVTKVMFIPSNF